MSTAVARKRCVAAARAVHRAGGRITVARQPACPLRIRLRLPTRCIAPSTGSLPQAPSAPHISEIGMPLLDRQREILRRPHPDADSGSGSTECAGPESMYVSPNFHGYTYPVSGQTSIPLALNPLRLATRATALRMAPRAPSAAVPGLRLNDRLWPLYRSGHRLQRFVLTALGTMEKALSRAQL